MARCSRKRSKQIHSAWPSYERAVGIPRETKYIRKEPQQNLHGLDGGARLAKLPYLGDHFDNKPVLCLSRREKKGTKNKRLTICFVCGQITCERCIPTYVPLPHPRSKIASRAPIDATTSGSLQTQLHQRKWAEAALFGRPDTASSCSLSHWFNITYQHLSCGPFNFFFLEPQVHSSDRDLSPPTSCPRRSP